jgi:hypothetical protein
MPRRGERARPVVRRSAGLDADQAWYQLRKEWQHLLAVQLFASTVVPFSSTPCA